MSVYKLGCNWGSGKPDFFNMLIEHSIVICAEHPMIKGDYVLITKGYTVVALAKILNDKYPCTSKAELDPDFQKYSISYEDWNYVADATIWVLDKDEQFRYQLQQGICRVWNQNTLANVQALLQKYTGQGTIIANPINSIQQIVTDCTDLVQANFNLVLTGAPGTGKTYLAKEIAKNMGATSDKCELVQFHPSYDYTDFVEGLRPVHTNGQLGFQRQDGIFKAFCKKALKEYQKVLQLFKKDLTAKGSIVIPCFRDTNKSITITQNGKGGIRVSPIETIIHTEYSCSDKDILDYLETGAYDKLHDTYGPSIGEYIKDNYELSPYVFIIDEINRGEISKIFGELFFSIDPGYRGIKGKVNTQYQNLIPQEGDTSFNPKNADVFRNGFFVPENVYIIGTMNDIDRSVESMDFAIRRRFAWKEIATDSRLSMLDDAKAWGNNGKPGQSVIDEIKIRMENLNNAIIDQYGINSISQKDRIGLTKAYQIGAAYFLRFNNYNDFQKLWDYHLKGLLYEYLRGSNNIDDKITRLKNAFDDTIKH